MYDLVQISAKVYSWNLTLWLTVAMLCCWRPYQGKPLLNENTCDTLKAKYRLLGVRKGDENLTYFYSLLTLPITAYASSHWILITLKEG